MFGLASLVSSVSGSLVWAGWSVGGLLAGGEGGFAGGVEGAFERVVERFEADLVAGFEGLAGADEVRAGALFLGGDDRAQHAVDGLVEGADDGMVVVEAGAVDADDQLGAGALERLALKLFERVAADLAVEVAGGGMALVAGVGGFVRGAAGANDQTPRRVARELPGGSGSAARRTVTCAVIFPWTLTSSSKSTGRCGSGSGSGRRTSSSWPDGSASETSRAGVFEGRAQLHELGDQRAQAPVGGEAF